MVLIVDDEPEVLGLMERILVEAGYTVHLASDAIAALEFLSTLSAPPSAVVTDLRMDPIDGASLGQMIHARWGDVPLLFISGFGSASQYGDLPGPFLPKPFDAGHLLDAVGRLMLDPHAPQAPS